MNYLNQKLFVFHLFLRQGTQLPIFQILSFFPLFEFLILFLFLPACASVFTMKKRIKKVENCIIYVSLLQISRILQKDAKKHEYVGKERKIWKNFVYSETVRP